MLGISFQSVFLATFQIVLLAAVGFICVRQKFLDDKGLELLSTLLVRVLLPQLIFYQLTQNFDFQQHRYWWGYPLITLSMTMVGVLVARALLVFNPGCEFKKHFLALVGFQNAGYVPLLLASSLFMGQEQSTLMVLIFLMIMGFDIGIWSLGVWLVTSGHDRGWHLKKMLNPPFLTTVCTLILIALGWHRYLPKTILRPIQMFGDCSLPLAMLVVGGNLALTKLNAIRRADIALLILAKLMIMPLLALLVVWIFRPGYLLGFLMVLEAAVPSAVSLSMIGRYYQVDSRLINQGIFWDSLVSVVTIPIFLSIYGQIAAN